MDSGWIVNFKDGTRVALDEEAYEFLENKLKKVVSEEHWFSLQSAIKKNPEIKLIKGCQIEL